jgi:hypothetical protein
VSTYQWRSVVAATEDVYASTVSATPRLRSGAIG